MRRWLKSQFLHQVSPRFQERRDATPGVDGHGVHPDSAFRAQPPGAEINGVNSALGCRDRSPHSRLQCKDQRSENTQGCISPTPGSPSAPAPQRPPEGKGKMLKKF